MQTASVPRSAWQGSTRSSPKKWDFPEPRPPCAALYRAGTSNGSKILAVGIFRVDNDALDFMDEFKGTVLAITDGLRGLAPATVQNGVGGRYPRGGSSIFRAHDADQNVERGPGVTARQRADFGDGFISHRRIPAAALPATRIRKAPFRHDPSRDRRAVWWTR